VLYVGRLSHEKNLEMLAHAFLALDDCAHLVIVGDGPARGDLVRLLAGHPVTFTGYLRGVDLATAYASADIFAFPSLTETFGQVVLEAMASGLPVIGFDAEGVRDLVEDRRTGRLIPRGDSASYAAALRALAASPELRQRLGEGARESARRRVWSRVMDDLVAQYAQVIERRRSARAA
jgi:glycosyltransferase involved in cell wall biosynthesis